MGVTTAGLILDTLSSGINNVINLGQREEQMAREDNAIQRQVADMKAAGLNPAMQNVSGSAANVGASALETPDLTNKMVTAESEEDAHETARLQHESLEYDNLMKSIDVNDYAQKKQDEITQRMNELKESDLDQQTKQKELEKLEAEKQKIWTDVKKINSDIKINEEEHKNKTTDYQKQWEDGDFNKRKDLFEWIVDTCYPNIDAGIRGKIISAGIDFKAINYEDAIEKANELYEQFSGKPAVQTNTNGGKPSSNKKEVDWSHVDEYEKYITSQGAKGYKPVKGIDDTYENWYWNRSPYRTK